jgi:hypothetical protein
MELTWTRRALLSLAVVAAFGLAGCTESTDSTTTETKTATVTMTVTPDPTTATASDDHTDADADGKDDYAWQGTVSATFAETNGVAVTINSVTVSMQESSGGIALSGGGTAKVKTTLNATTNSIDANGTAVVGIVVHYTLPNAGREALLTVTSSLTDANAHTGTFTDTVTIK